VLAVLVVIARSRLLCPKMPVWLDDPAGGATGDELGDDLLLFRMPTPKENVRAGLCRNPCRGG